MSVNNWAAFGRRFSNERSVNWLVLNSAYWRLAECEYEQGSDWLFVPLDVTGGVRKMTHLCCFNLDQTWLSTHKIAFYAWMFVLVHTMRRLSLCVTSTGTKCRLSQSCCHDFNWERTYGWIPPRALSLWISPGLLHNKALLVTALCGEHYPTGWQQSVVTLTHTPWASHTRWAGGWGLQCV